MQHLHHIFDSTHVDCLSTGVCKNYIIFLVTQLFKSRISLIWGTIVTLSILVYFRIKLNFDCKNVSLQTRLFPINREIMSLQI